MTDRWGIDWRVELADTVPFPKGNPLSDIRKIDNYQFPDPSKLIISESTKENLKSVDRDSKLVMGNMTYLLFERAWALMGMENFFMALIDFPEECHYLLHKIAIYAKTVFSSYINMGADAISFSEDLGSQKALMMSPKHFKEFLLPEYEFIFSDIIREKKIINFHSCGCVDSIANDLADIGIKVLNPLQARCNDLHMIKSLTLGRMALSGGIDTATILSGTPNMVKAEVIRILDILKPGGGYIIGPDQHFPNFPKENLDALWNTAKEYGKY